MHRHIAWWLAKEVGIGSRFNIMMEFERFGGRRSFLRLVRARTYDLLGAYRPLKAVPWNATKRVVFICKGNICRSPYAEMRADSLGIETASFGLDTVDGAPANDSAISVAGQRGLDLTKHRSRQLRDAELNEQDLVMLFEPSHVAIFRALTLPDHKVSLLGLWGGVGRPYIADPYNRPAVYFQECFGAIDRALESLAPRLRRKP